MVLIVFVFFRGSGIHNLFIHVLHVSYISLYFCFIGLYRILIGLYDVLQGFNMCTGF